MFGMLPGQYAEEDRYGLVRYVERYGAGGGADLYSMGYGDGDRYGVPVVAYGGDGYGADSRYGVDALLYGTFGVRYGSGYGSVAAVGESGDAYGAFLDAVDPFDYLDEMSSYSMARDGWYAVPAGSMGFDAATEGSYPDAAPTWLAMFGRDWDYT